MQYLYVILPLLVMSLIPIVTGKVSYKQVINSIFYGLLASIVVMLVLSFFHLGAGSESLIFVFLTAALPEELAKFLCIKAANSKSETSIFINTILVAITFAVFENVLYMYAKGLTVGISRTLAPGHFIFDIFMALFLILALKSKGAKKGIFISLSLVIPMILHTCFNFFDIKNEILMVIGIIAYIFSIIYMITLPKEKVKVKALPFKEVVCAIITLITLVLIFNGGTINSLNKDIYIKDDNITMNVMNIEKINKKDKFDDNKYRVKVKITNSNKDDFNILLWNLIISNDMNKNTRALFAYDENNEELNTITIKPDETKTIYIDFSVDEFNYEYFIYHTHKVDYTPYTFNIK